MTSITVQGMTCEHCVARVDKALKRTGLTDVRIDLSTGKVDFEGAFDFETLNSAIEDAGYTLLQQAGL